MNILKNRPLGMILCVFLGGFILSSISDYYGRIILFTLSLALSACVFLIPAMRQKRFIIASVALLISVLFSSFYFGIAFYPDKYYGEVEVEARITAKEEISSGIASYDIDAFAVNGNRVSYKFKTYVYGYSDDISEGDTVAFTGKLTAFEDEGSFNFKNYYAARGFSARLTVSEYEVLAKGELPVSSHFAKWRSAISERAIALTDSYSGGLIAALLLGERDFISPKLELDFTRIGIVHILSLSGMHLAIFSGIIDKLLALIGCGKKVRTISSCLFSLIFMTVTGFPVTIVRAGVMLIISSLLMLACGNRDGITSLMLTAVLIVIVNPNSALDTGFLLSVLSTLGLITAADYAAQDTDGQKPTLRTRVIGYVKLSFIFSFFAILASLLITALTFDGFSTFSIITTFIFSPLTEVFLIVSIVTLIFGGALGLGTVCKALGGFIGAFADLLSDIPMAYTSSASLAVKIVAVILALMFFVFLLIDIKNKRRFVGIMIASYAVMIAISLTLTNYSLTRDAITVNSSEDCDMILVSGEASAIFDSSSHKRSHAYEISEYVYSSGVSELDVYITPTYSNTLPDMIDLLLSRIKIEKCILPSPGEDEVELFNSIASILDIYGVGYEFYTGEPILLGDTEYVSVEYETRKDYCVVFRNKDTVCTYFTSGALVECYKAEALLYSSQTVVFGAYGSGYQHAHTIDEFGDRLKLIINYDNGIVIDKIYANAMDTETVYGTKYVVKFSDNED
jgi:ComEC/Rec2-related protein